jgi:hypothetical protein
LADVEVRLDGEEKVIDMNVCFTEKRR